MDNIKKDIGQRIRYIRKEKKLTQEDLGSLCGLSYKFISDVERGKQNASIDSIASIAKALKVDIANLFIQDTDTPFKFSHEELQTLKRTITILRKFLKPVK